MVSTTVTVWLQVAVLLQPSVACQVRVTACAQPKPLTLSKEMILMLVPQQVSVTVGGSSKLHWSPPHSTVLLTGQLLKTGGVVSTAVTV